jgi:hypothetical protein
MKERNYLKNTDVEWKIILKCILDKYGGMACIVFMWLGVECERLM